MLQTEAVRAGDEDRSDPRVASAPEIRSLLEFVRYSLDAPMAALTFVESADLYWSVKGDPDAPHFNQRRTPFFQQALASQDLLVVSDATRDVRFAEDPLVAAEPRVRFFASMPVFLEAGEIAGAVCIFDTWPRSFTKEKAERLASLADMVSAMLRQRLRATKLEASGRELHAQALLIREQAASLAQSRKLFEGASTVAKIGVWECRLASGAIHWTDAIYDMFELPRGSEINRPQILRYYSAASLEELEARRDKAIAERNGFTLDAQIVTARGNRRWIRVTATVECEDGVAVRLIGMKRNITEEKTLSDRTRFLAEFDVLTGLANRSLFQTKLAALSQEQSDESVTGALILLDVDRFKQINDTFGHAMGDDCLKEIAVRLQEVCREAELVARIGGDEFAVLLAPGSERTGIERLAVRIVDELRRPIKRSGQSFQLGASLGIAIKGDVDRTRPSDLFTNADVALYAAKAAGRNTFRFFEPVMKHTLDRRLSTIKNVASALNENQLELYYQPKFRLADLSLAGFEALLRCRMPDRTIAASGGLKAAFEDPELSRKLGNWVIENALAQAARWKQAGFDFGHLAMNVSSAQIHESKFAESLIARIHEYGVEPSTIEVEITEGVFLDNDSHSVQRQLELLNATGIRIALDDFGTGYASLVHLRSCSVDTLKIDRSFVKHFLTSRPDAAILEAILHLGLRLGMEVVAEGVEEMQQLVRLQALGCPSAQGFLFSKPVPATEISNCLVPVTPKLECVA